MSASTATHQPVWRSQSDFVIAAQINPGETDVEAEQLWVRKIDESHFELSCICIPFFLYDVDLGDIIEVDESLIFQSVAERSGGMSSRQDLEARTGDRYLHPEHPEDPGLHSMENRGVNRVTQAETIEALVNDVPDLRPTLAEHLEDNFGELLTHLFMGDVARYAEGLEPNGQDLARLMSLLDGYYTDGDEATRELLEVSFIENLGYRSPLIRRLGPVMAATTTAKALRS